MTFVSLRLDPSEEAASPGQTDRRDAIRLVRMAAAGELRFAFAPSLADEHFRDLVLVIEYVRGEFMRSRHRLGKFFLRRGEMIASGTSTAG